MPEHVRKIDWFLFFLILPVLAAGLITMKSFSTDASFFARQLVWIGVSISVFFVFSAIDFRFLKRTNVLVPLFLFFCGLLVLLFALGHISNGAQSWFRL